MSNLKKILEGKMMDEFLDRYEELTEGWSAAASGGSQSEGGLESMGGGLDAIDFTKDKLANALESPEPSSSIPDGLEAIILQFGRPAYFIQDGTFKTEGTPSSSAEIDGVVNGAKEKLDLVIPSVGRINLRNHQMNWIGTGWVVAENIVVTNRHVAREFAEPDGAGFAFVESYDGRAAKAELDTIREYQRGKESVFKMPEVLWIEPNKAGHHDVAFLKIKPEGENDQPQPDPIQLMTDDEIDDIVKGDFERWLAVIGYPAYSIYNNAADQQRIFQGVFDVKRLQPGQRLPSGKGTLLHDATTLGGNSGSAVIDLQTGKAMALHFGGYEGETNFAVSAKVVRKLMQAKLKIG